MDQVGTFRRIADVLRSAQRAAIEVENAPDKRKRLRTFSAQEVAGLLGVPQKALRLAATQIAAERPTALRPRLTFAEVEALRLVFQAASGGERFVPRRDPGRGETLAVVAFTNFKGGSAKTTSSVHFAQFMALAGYRVLLVDLDSQGSATAQFGIDPSEEVGRRNSFVGWLTASGKRGQTSVARAIPQSTYWPTIHLVPAGAVLAEAEELLSRRAASGEAGATLY